MPPEGDGLSALRKRLEFMGLDDEQRASLKQAKPVLMQALATGMERFYEKLGRFPETNRFFKNPQHREFARSRQIEHWGTITEGEYGAEYVDGVTAVGKAHARIGLEPRWYIGGYALLIEETIKGVMSARWPEILKKKKKAKPDELAAEIGLFVKAALLDMDYAITVYLDELAEERRKAEEQKERADAAKEAALASLASVLQQLAAGNLEARLDDDLPEEFVKMAHDYNDAVESLRVTLAKTRRTSEKIVENIGEVNVSMEKLSDRSVQQAASLEQSSAALHELTESVQNATEHSQKAAEVVGAARSDAQQSERLVNEAIGAMSEIEKSSTQIAKIISVIDGIAFQTNLLALNASVEAARAGEAGKGFAVVAHEVRALAQRSADAAREIKDLVETSQGHVENGVTIVGHAGKALSKIIERVAEIHELVGTIAIQSKEQSVGLGEINQSIVEMDNTTQRNTAMAAATSEKMAALNGDAVLMRQEMTRFWVRDPNRTAVAPGSERRHQSLKHEEVHGQGPSQPLRRGRAA